MTRQIKDTLLIVCGSCLSLAFFSALMLHWEAIPLAAVGVTAGAVSSWDRQSSSGPSAVWVMPPSSFGEDDDQETEENA